MKIGQIRQMATDCHDVKQLRAFADNIFGRAHGISQIKEMEAHDIYIPPHIPLRSFEDYCDTLELPCYHVTERTFSVASTYLQLLEHENAR